MSAPDRGGAGSRLAVVLAVLAAVLVVFLSRRATPTPPFSLESSEVDGYRAIGLLMQDAGADVRSVVPARLAELDVADDADLVVIVPVPATLSDSEAEELEGLAEAGATVVHGEPSDPSGPEGLEDFPFDSASFRYPRRLLADTEPAAVDPGVCDLPELEDLREIDGQFATPLSVPDGDRSCFGDGRDALVVERRVGDGRLVTLGGPLLWANARLQPMKEEGGEPLDNGASALRVTRAGEGIEVVMVEPTPTSGMAPAGTRDPVELLPLPVKLALGQAGVALLLHLWWKGRRLGRPVGEPLPVEIAASELVAAVGDLLRRKGNPERAARAMREDTRRLLASRLGSPGDARPAELVAEVARRTGRASDDVAATLLDPSTDGAAGGTPVRSTDELVRLAHRLDSIRQEVLDDQPVR